MFNVISIITSVLALISGIAGILVGLLSNTYFKKRKQIAAIEKCPSFVDLTSKRQRKVINRNICHRYEALLGRKVEAVPYRPYSAAYAGGIIRIDLQAELDGIRSDFSVMIPNPHATPIFSDGKSANKFQAAFPMAPSIEIAVANLSAEAFGTRDMKKA